MAEDDESRDFVSREDERDTFRSVDFWKWGIGDAKEHEVTKVGSELSLWTASST